jgi:hypothetical protein
MNELVLLVHVFSTLSMVGLIWFVQIVHYPLFKLVGDDGFSDYERGHQQLTTRVVAPLMLIELTSAAYLLLRRPEGVVAWLPWTGLTLLAVVWGSTFFLQVAAHEELASRFHVTTHHRLVRSNWIRTTGWTLRGLLVCGMCWQAMDASV